MCNKRRQQENMNGGPRGNLKFVVSRFNALAASYNIAPCLVIFDELSSRAYKKTIYMAYGRVQALLPRSSLCLSVNIVVVACCCYMVGGCYVVVIVFA